MAFECDINDMNIYLPGKTPNSDMVVPSMSSEDEAEDDFIQCAQRPFPGIEEEELEVVLSTHDTDSDSDSSDTAINSDNDDDTDGSIDDGLADYCSKEKKLYHIHTSNNFDAMVSRRHGGFCIHSIRPVTIPACGRVCLTVGLSQTKDFSTLSVCTRINADHDMMMNTGVAAMSTDVDVFYTNPIKIILMNTTDHLVCMNNSADIVATLRVMPYLNTYVPVSTGKLPAPTGEKKRKLNDLK